MPGNWNETIQAQMEIDELERNLIPGHIIGCKTKDGIIHSVNYKN